MPTKKSAKNWLMRMNKWTMFGLLAVFVVLFVGTGVLVHQKSQASGLHCTGGGGNFSSYSTLRLGSTGTCVVYLQELVNGVHALAATENRQVVGAFDPFGSSFLSTDGLFGSLTQLRTREAQRFMRIGVDGVVGPATWRALCSYTSGQNLQAIRNGGYPAYTKYITPADNAHTAVCN